MTREEAIDLVEIKALAFPSDAEDTVAALCAAIPGLGDVLGGAACIVPKEPTEEMATASRMVHTFTGPAARVTMWGANAWPAMIAASPYRSKPDGRE